jgi:hypothetical protein
MSLLSGAFATMDTVDYQSANASVRLTVNGSITDVGVGSVGNRYRCHRRGDLLHHEWNRALGRFHQVHGGIHDQLRPVQTAMILLAAKCSKPACIGLRPAFSLSGVTPGNRE